MAISTPSSYGLIALRGSQAEAFLVAEWQPSAEQVEAHSDEKLFGLAIAQSSWEAALVVEQLKAQGLEPGRDFAITSSAFGIYADTAPPWLSQVGDRWFEFKG